MGGAILILDRLRSGWALEWSPVRYAALEQQFEDLLAGRSADVPEGFVRSQFAVPFEGIQLEEAEGERRGAGVYVLRQSAGRPLLIGAPHRRADRLTGPLAVRLLAESGALAGAWNSVPRHGACRQNSDLARLARHPFTAFAVAFARTHRTGRVIQLHGFARELRTTPEGRSASVILSSGERQVQPAVLAVAQCLQVELPDEQILVYPDEVSELGALGNAQGQKLRDIGFTGFIHAELSLKLRRRLLHDDGLRRRFATCLGAGL